MNDDERFAQDLDELFRVSNVAETSLSADEAAALASEVIRAAGKPARGSVRFAITISGLILVCGLVGGALVSPWAFVGSVLLSGGTGWRLASIRFARKQPT
jgi:hypothetical protein